ncbi:hypothetical protein DFQ27_008384 [Actinomortierella ambigua]|uniref:Uncharacterized protein n=1 Tax=Actinomortierella ambigua TaxID=1343610 RepID=A0A9P6UBE1_9FUNG|nr:hypothetical protein DFQ27_008384 [Actinomortierella ambigua]
MSLPEHLRWVQNKVPGVEHVSLEDFVNEFNLNDMQMATEMYRALIDSNEIRAPRREKLKEAFRVFQANNADVFWSQRKLQISSEITSNDAAKDLQVAAVEKSRQGYAKVLLQSNPVVSAASGVPPTGSSSSKRNNRRKKAITLMDEPWKGLTKNLHQLINDQPVNQFATITPNMPHLHEQLFHHTVHLLSEYKEQEPANKDESLVKEAQVAMSCVLDTMSSRTVQYFASNGDNDVITRAVSRLQDYDVRYRARQLLRDRHELQKPYDLGEILPEEVQMKERVLVILEYLCRVVSNPPFKREDASENDALLVWAHVLDLARSNDRIALQSGERMLETSKVLRQQQAAEFCDISDAGRTVDLAFVHKDIELSNIGFKRPGISTMDINVQCRKNIRLGRCIQEQHRKYGVQEPSVIMGDVAGAP